MRCRKQNQYFHRGDRCASLERRNQCQSRSPIATRLAAQLQVVRAGTVGRWLTALALGYLLQARRSVARWNTGSAYGNRITRPPNRTRQQPTSPIRLPLSSTGLKEDGHSRRPQETWPLPENWQVVGHPARSRSPFESINVVRNPIGGILGVCGCRLQRMLWSSFRHRTNSLPVYEALIRLAEAIARIPARMSCSTP